jgi:hypothetical protein
VPDGRELVPVAAPEVHDQPDVHQDVQHDDAESQDAAQEAKRAGHAYVILDGTLIPVDRAPAAGRSTPASTKSTA